MNISLDFNIVDFLKIINVEMTSDREKLLGNVIYNYGLNVRYQNLHVFNQSSNYPSLSPGVLFDNLLLQKKGGICFEICELIFHALKELNFDAHRVRTQVYNMGNDEPNPLVTHNIVFVRINQKKYFIDCGCSYNILRYPIQFSFEETEEKEIFPGETYKLVCFPTYYQFQIKIKNEYFKMYIFQKNSQTNEPLFGTDQQLQNDYMLFFQSPTYVAIRDSHIKCGGLTEEGRECFYFNEREKIAKEFYFIKGEKVKEIKFRRLGEFLDAIENKYHYPISKHINRDLLLIQ